MNNIGGSATLIHSLSHIVGEEIRLGSRLSNAISRAYKGLFVVHVLVHTV